ncbi:MAG: hypothetical protein CR967_04455 [Proteobacteria bacterium]|nr:MAG: hypothetical protein CR967_04455 [Pseudomonadota bacterium]
MLSFGKKGERRAIKFLKKQKLKILKTNFHSRFGEIDIIAKDKTTLHFIEVKASKDYDPIERITPQKYQKILKTIDYYMYQNPNDLNFQIDAILVKDKQIEWLENISF